jgi:S1-C subfamily serine protease
MFKIGFSASVAWSSILLAVILALGGYVALCRRSPHQATGALGIVVEDVTPQAAQEMNLLSTSGALVTEVRRGSPAESGGMLPGDVIIELNAHAVAQATDFHTGMGALRSGDRVQLKVSRHGRTVFLNLEIT